MIVYAIQCLIEENNISIKQSKCYATRARGKISYIYKDKTLRIPESKLNNFFIRSQGNKIDNIHGIFEQDIIEKNENIEEWLKTTICSTVEDYKLYCSSIIRKISNMKLKKRIDK